MKSIDMRHASCLDFLPTVRTKSVHCVVTSPTAFRADRKTLNVRTVWPEVSYGSFPGMDRRTTPATTCSLGSELVPEAYAGHLVHVFREVRRVLRPDGVAWISLKDSWDRTRDLWMIPQRVIGALVADGWHLKAQVTVQKINGAGGKGGAAPISVREELFMLTNWGQGYFYNNLAKTHGLATAKTIRSWWDVGADESEDPHYQWRVETDAHDRSKFQVMPSEVARRCIRVSTSPAGCCPRCLSQYEVSSLGPVQPCACAVDGPTDCTVLDPFMGLGTTAAVCAELGRRFIGCEIDEQTYRLCVERVGKVAELSQAIRDAEMDRMHTRTRGEAIRSIAATESDLEDE